MIEIVKASNINARQNHQDAFANFYSDVWRREFGTLMAVMPSLLLATLNRNIKVYGAKITQDPVNNQYTLVFDQEQNYTWFELKWASHYDPAYSRV